MNLLWGVSFPGSTFISTTLFVRSASWRIVWALRPIKSPVGVELGQKQKGSVGLTAELT
ncbi:hypothetical protein [Leptolyngbya ohadii]|uniref:hypothetical protein n=1 Tax=Leptolyngbya ohadii TaxID=1962290 RepID=UPI0015C68FA4|nr:hypothetical protein [Leptolyngbya ohadii]